jgi:hypothetical protein
LSRNQPDFGIGQAIEGIHQRAYLIAYGGAFCLPSQDSSAFVGEKRFVVCLSGKIIGEQVLPFLRY